MVANFGFGPHPAETIAVAAIRQAMHALRIASPSTAQLRDDNLVEHANSYFLAGRIG